jgi:ubiquitin-small subunit ribosomal protein S27Ae
MGKKRKKKIYNTPKKIKHIHKNEKLNVIKVFNNNPKCLECNNYMATHSERYTCNYCNYSKLKN